MYLIGLFGRAKTVKRTFFNKTFNKETLSQNVK